MTDIKVPSSGNIRVWWALPNAFANYEAPTVTELANALDISDAVSWNDFDFGLQASNTNEDPAITARGKVFDRGAAQFGGGISLYYPRDFDDNSNVYSLVYDALDQPRTIGWLVVRIDGEEATAAAAAGDILHVFKVMTDGYAESITGEEAFRYTVNFLSQGDLAPNAIVVSGTPAVVVTGDSTLDVGDKVRFTATVAGREYTNGVRWSSSNTALATVSKAGVVTAVAAGSVTITATHEATGANDTESVTIS
jgi:hypothetical protein